MQPLYFGDSRRPLFGVYEPTATATSDLAVLICPPIGQEHVRVHRALRALSRALTQAGGHVLRFDYTGVGDSWGDSAAGGVPQWTEDVRVAAEELLAMSGASRLALLGLRFGATLAALATGDGVHAERLVLWDPVLDGAAYLSALDRLHARMLVDPKRFPAPRSSGPDERLGFPLPPAVRSSIAAARPFADPAFRPSRVALFAGRPSPEVEQACQVANARGVEATYRVLDADGAWDDLDQIEETLLPGPHLGLLVRAACGEPREEAP